MFQQDKFECKISWFTQYKIQRMYVKLSQISIRLTSVCIYRYSHVKFKITKKMHA